MDLGLHGKKAIIGGGARGIGRATAELLAKEGCDVALTARSKKGVAAVVDALNKEGVTAWGRAVNVKKTDAYKEWLEDAVKELGGCDILIPIGRRAVEWVAKRTGPTRSKSIL